MRDDHSGSGDECREERAAAMQLPPRMARFMERVARLPEGRYILTLTINSERGAFWTIQEMNQVER